MNIAFFHRDSWPLTEGSAIQSWQIYSRLQKHHTVFTPSICPFPHTRTGYRDFRDTRNLLQSVDVIFIIVDGLSFPFEEKFSFLPSLMGLHTPVVWLLNAPIEETLLSSRFSRHFLYFEQMKRKLLSSFVDVCICVSPALETYARRHLLAKKYTVIPNGSDPNFILPRPHHGRHIYIKQKQFSIIWAGSGQYRWQAIDVISKVATLLAHTDPTIKITLITEQPWYPITETENLAVMNPIDYFHMQKVMQKADLALCLYHEIPPLKFYNSPLKLFDAMSAGLPVIATDIGQIHDVIVNRKNGFLTNNNPKEIVSIISYIKSHPKEASKIGERARKSITSYYNWDRMTEEISTILEQVTHKHI